MIANLDWDGRCYPFRPKTIATVSGQTNEKRPQGVLPFAASFARWLSPYYGVTDGAVGTKVGSGRHQEGLLGICNARYRNNSSDACRNQLEKRKS